MAPAKRKQPHEEADTLPTRRATRQHPTTTSATTTDEPPKQLRSGRTRASDVNENPFSSSLAAPKENKGKRKSTITDSHDEDEDEDEEDGEQEDTRPASRDGPKRTTAIPPPSIPSSPEETSRVRGAHTHTQLKGTRQARGSLTRKGPVSPEVTSTGARVVETPISPPKHPLQVQQRDIGGTVLGSGSASAKLQAVSGQHQTQIPPPKKQDLRQQELAASPAITPSSTNPKASVATTPKRQTKTSLSKPPSTPGPDRNIDKVFFGNICFRAWYPSYYPKEVLADSSGNAGGGVKDGGGGTVGKIGGGKGGGGQQPILERLLVCPCCFKYSREMETWRGHVRYCERHYAVPGRKVYTHPRQGVRKLKINKAKRKEEGGHVKEGDGGGEGVPELDHRGEWSVWEVDGEKDGLFCQNLSLFAKLFLDSKSVFFDVTGFHYFLLVYTPPDDETSQGKQSIPKRPHILGFFSKEKLSWDNNNLACILVFPPWQRKGLGSLLMGVSYGISRREGVLGGPEKPISELGRKGYKRFWAGEVARWLLSLPVSAPRSEKRRAAKHEKPEEEQLVDITDCSDATWIVPEDCLQILRDMGIVEDAGMGPGKAKPTIEGEAGDTKHNGTSSAADHDAPGADGEEEAKLVPRVRVDKAAVQKWVETNRINLERTFDPDGFVAGYALPKESSDASE